MSTLTSSSTSAEIEAAYLDNASYEEDEDVGKCKAFLTACRIILFKRPQRSAHRGAGSEMQWDLRLIQKEIDRAEAWLAAQAGMSGATDNVVHPDFSFFSR